MGRLADLPSQALLGGRLRLHIAATPRARLLGLALSDPPPPEAALLIPGCRSVHTFGMRFALDLIWLDRAGAPLKVDHDVAPRRLRSCRHASAVVEVPAGAGQSFVVAIRSARRADPGAAPAP